MTQFITSLILILLKVYIYFEKCIRLIWCKYVWKVKEYIIVPNIDILYESDNFIIVNKLADMVINDMDRSRVSVEHQLAARYPNLANENLPFRFYFTHRLDYSTSGILCIVKNKRACGKVCQGFELRNTQKFYVAILRGHLSVDSMKIKERIGQDLLHNHRMAIETMPNCSKNHKSAETHLQVLERGLCYNYPATKVLLRPITGRRHQLRLHCHHIGHTIVGDFTYSNKHDILPFRMFLHAIKLKMNSSLELLDIITPDPFTMTDSRNSWKSLQTVKTLSDAFHELY